MELDSGLQWAPWLLFEEAVRVAPREPGVYVARERPTGQIVYIGMAGERRGQGIRGRLRIYLTGKAAVSGLGEAALDRALADPAVARSHDPTHSDRRSSAGQAMGAGSSDPSRSRADLDRQSGPRDRCDYRTTPHRRRNESALEPKTLASR